MKIHNTALTCATTVSIWLIVLLTILTEISAPLKSFLVSLTGHHWPSKGIITLATFLLTYFILSRKEESGSVLRGAWTVVWSIVFGGLMILFFFLYEFLGA